MANVVANGTDIHYTGMVVKVINDNTVVVSAINAGDSASRDVPLFPTGTRYHDCLDAVKRKGGKEWVPGKFVDGIPLNGTPVKLRFSPWTTESGKEWKVDWFRIDGYNPSDGTMRDR